MLNLSTQKYKIKWFVISGGKPKCSCIQVSGEMRKVAGVQKDSS